MEPPIRLGRRATAPSPTETWQSLSTLARLIMRRTPRRGRVSRRAFARAQTHARRGFGPPKLSARAGRLVVLEQLDERACKSDRIVRAGRGGRFPRRPPRGPRRARSDHGQHRSASPRAQPAQKPRSETGQRERRKRRRETLRRRRAPTSSTCARLTASASSAGRSGPLPYDDEARARPPPRATRSDGRVEHVPSLLMVETSECHRRRCRSRLESELGPVRPGRRTPGQAAPVVMTRETRFRASVRTPPLRSRPPPSTLGTA